MKYIFMMNTMKATGGAFPNWTQEDVQKHIKFMMDLNRELKASGEFVLAEGLTFPDQARLVRADDEGRPITDGVFPEGKEFLAGFWILDVASPERAYEIAARISNAPGASGKPLKMSIEVRPVASAPPNHDLP